MKSSDSLMKRVFGDRKEEDRGAEDLLRRTKGISLVIYTTSSGHTIHFRDLAGQQDFSAPHCLFHPSAGLQKAGLIVADGKLSIREIQRDLELSAGNLICCHQIGKKIMTRNTLSSFFVIVHIYSYDMLLHVTLIREEKRILELLAVVHCCLVQYALEVLSCRVCSLEDLQLHCKMDYAAQSTCTVALLRLWCVEDGCRLEVGVVFTRKDVITEVRKAELRRLYTELRASVGHLLDLQFYRILDAQSTQDEATKEFIRRFDEFCVKRLEVSQIYLKIDVYFKLDDTIIFWYLK